MRRYLVASYLILAVGMFFAVRGVRNHDLMVIRAHAFVDCRHLDAVVANQKLVLHTLLMLQVPNRDQLERAIRDVPPFRC